MVYGAACEPEFEILESCIHSGNKYMHIVGSILQQCYV